MSVLRELEAKIVHFVPGPLIFRALIASWPSRKPDCLGHGYACSILRRRRQSVSMTLCLSVEELLLFLSFAVPERFNGLPVRFTLLSLVMTIM